MDKRILRAHFDGGCFPNPGGHASCACLIEFENEEVYRKSVYLGCGDGMTNNVAEYSGLKLILKYLLKNPHDCLIIGDSLTVINRMRSATKDAGSGMCAPVAAECKAIQRKLGVKLQFIWQSRTRNEECDAMCSLEIEEAQSQEWHRQFA
jgi:ribonuclease HI